MTVYVAISGDLICIRARAEGPGAIGDLVRTIGPGESFLGHPYGFWRGLGDGEHRVHPAAEG
jgi:hypothetical protein